MTAELTVFSIEITHTAAYVEIAELIARAARPDVAASKTLCCEGEGFDVEICARIGTPWGGDQQTEVRIALSNTGEGACFDTALMVHNNDCLSMYEQIEMMQFAVEWFDRLRKDVGLSLIGHND